MTDLSRRVVVKAAAVAGLAAVGGRALAAQETQNDSDNPESSGATSSQVPNKELELNVAELEAAPQAAGLQSFFGRISPDASPGRNTLTINGLPAGTRVVTVWMTEWISGNQPHAGAAFFYTTSVQLYDNGRKCRVIFNLDWNRHLPAACQVIYG